MNFLTVLFGLISMFTPVPDDGGLERWSAYINAYKVYLGFVVREEEQRMDYMSIEVETSFSTGTKFVLLDDTVKTTLDWYKVEKSPGVYDWREYDKKMIELVNHPIILTIRNAPEFYRRWSNYICSPPKPEYYVHYANFVQKVINRYNPVAIELWNEPDVPRVSPNIWYFGCWKELGGNEYGRFVRIVYTRLKYNGIVFAGAFMMDSSEQEVFAKNAIMTVGNKIDGWSFHAYPWYSRSNLDFQRFERKASFLRKFTHKKLYLSETSLLCKREWIICDDKFERAKADYFNYVYNRNAVSYWTWFEMKNTWRNCSLIAKNGTKLPAYYEYERLSSK